MITKEEEKKNSRFAALISLCVHIVVIILFMIFGMDVMDPPPQEYGVEISMADIGNTMDGAGEVTPTKVSEAVNESQNQEAQPKPVEQAATEEVATDAKSEVAVPTAEEPVEKPKKEVEKPKKEESQPKDEPQKIKERSLYPGKTSDESGQKQGGSQGDTEGLGDRGNPDGRPEGRGALGSGNGSWELSGRSLLKGASIETTKEEGIVVLKIKVDRNGNVIDAYPDLTLTNTTSEYLIGLAKSAAKRTKYSVNPDAPVEQMGKMTFKFILQ